MTRRSRHSLIILLLFFPLFLPGFQVLAQNRVVVDSLERKLGTSAPDTNRINILISLAFHLRSSDILRARKLRDQAYFLSKKFNYIRGKGWYYYLEGIDLTYQNKFFPALNAEAIAIDLGHQAKDHELVSRAYNTIGVNHLRLEDDESAMKAFNTALRFIGNTSDQSFKPALLLNIGKIYSKDKKYPEALAKFGQSLKLYLSLGNKSGAALTYLQIGRVYFALGDYGQAIVNGNLSLSFASQVNLTRTVINALILLGSSHTNLNNLRQARNYLEESAALTVFDKMEDEKLRMYYGFAALSEREGNYKEAFLYKKKSSQLHDSLFNLNRSNLRIEFQEKFQTQQKARENKLLRSKQLAMHDKIKQRNQILYLTFGVLIGFVIFSFILFWGNRHIKRSNYILTIRKDQIQEQKEHVEQSNQIKDKLFSLIAHDLRSPFASMKSMMDMYDEGIISKEDLDFFFREIRKDIGFNSLLLDNLLVWAKSQLHGFRIDLKPVSLDRLSIQVLGHYKKQLEGKEISITMAIPAGTVVYADYEMTNTVIRNLVGNAIKFTPKKGSIVLSCTERDNNILIKIVDSGIGISQQNKEKLFQDTFFTTEGLNKEKGTGLGLQICKEFVESNNGKIWVESETGAGSSFCFTLPKSNDMSDEIFFDQDEADEAAKNSIKKSIKDNISLQHKYDRYEMLSKASNDTIRDSDFIGGEVSWNEALNVNFGYPNERTSIEWWYEKIHPADFDDVKASVINALDEKGDKWESEYRFRCADGTYKYVLDRGFILYDDEEKPFRFMGIMQNIDAQKNTDSEIQRLSLVATKVNNMVVITDAEDRIVWVNNAFENHTKYALAEIIGQRPQYFLSGTNTDQRVLKKIDKSLEQRKNFSVELINYTKFGVPYWIQIDTTQYVDPITKLIGYVSIQTVITERKEDERILTNMNKTLREIAHICSSDVQAPLQSILEFIKLLNKNNISQSEAQDYIVLLNLSAEKLDSLIYKIHNHISKMERESV